MNSGKLPILPGSNSIDKTNPRTDPPFAAQEYQMLKSSALHVVCSSKTTQVTQTSPLQARRLPWYWLVCCVLVWLSMGCSSDTTKKTEGQPCRETSECNTPLECRNLVCAPIPQESTATETSDGEISPEESPASTESTEIPESTEHSDVKAEETVDGSLQDNPDTALEQNPSEDVAEAPESSQDATDSVSAEETQEQVPEQGPTIPPGMFLRCTVQSTCQTGLQCVQGFCVQPCYRFSDPLDCPSPAHYLCTEKEFCTLRCRDNTGQDDSLLCPVGMRCEDGACIAGASTSQGTAKEGESCQTNGCDGTLGLVCLPQLSQCVKICDPRLTTNPSCSAQEECVPESRFSLTAFSPLQGVCVPKPTKKQGESCDIFAQQCISPLRCDSSDNTPVCRMICDLRKGTSLNAVCTLREYCDGSGSKYPQGICKPLPEKSSTGTDVFGAPCTTASCDSEKFLFCDGVENVCVRGCRPKDGVTTNSLCSLNEVCVEEVAYHNGAVRSHWGGRCFPPAQRSLGESCDAVNQRCRTGLLCHNQRCHKECDTSQGQENNPGCPTTAPHHCLALTNGLGICQTLCDPEKSLTAGSACAVGQYCHCLDGQCCVAGKCPDVVYCTYSAALTTGTKKLGEGCSSSDPKNQCDGSRNLFCRLGRCETSCDPRKGKTNNLHCSTTQECIAGSGISEGSPLQGLCVDKGVRKSGESCDSTLRCQDPLVCVGGICEQPCDPKQGIVANATCADTHYCRKTLGISQGGVCVRLPSGRTGKRLTGERCTHDPSLASKSCEEAKGLTCDEGQSICVNACQPKDGVTNNPKCGLTEECVENIQSHRGGLCVPAASHRQGEWCNTTHQRCLTGLICSRGQCHTPCDPAKGETNNTDCPSSKHRCIRGVGFDQKTQGVCFVQCDPSQGVTTNAACTRTQLCQADAGKVTTGLCVPLQPAGTGTQKANDACRQEDPDLRCGPDLVCASFSFGSRCTPTCDRSQGRQACNNPGWACLASTSSSTGGYCSPP